MGGGAQFPIHFGSAPVKTVQDLGDKHLHAVVDIGSNGIRCSISDLSPPTARIIPTVYARRFNISLYDAQFDPETSERVPIPQDVIDAVVGAVVRFQVVCVGFGVPSNHISIIATEATRTAKNSKQLTQGIKGATGLQVEILPKEREGIIGAWGIASGFSDIEGLAMDLGGGSMQITWIMSHAGKVQISPKGSVSFPYGAAALTQKLESLKRGKNKKEARKAEEAFRREVEDNIRNAWERLEIPDHLANKARREGGFQVYLSGGGFRGWGYLLLYIHQVRGEYYPISIINGYSARKEDFENTDAIKREAKAAHKIFRISDRRRKQVPSVAFLVNALAEAIPYGVKEAHFCQGGVREGLLFQQLVPILRQQNPLEVATARFARPSAQTIAYLILAAIPRPEKDRRLPRSIGWHTIQAFAQSLYIHAEMSKELGPTAALYSTSTGILCSASGIPHNDRARLALLLQERYGGELPPREHDFKKRLQNLLTPEEVWWTRYLGKLGLVLARLYPTGKVDPARPRVLPTSRWADDLGKRKDKEGIELKILVQKVAYDPTWLKEELEPDLKKIQKVGKRKNWIGGRDGWGMKVDVQLIEDIEDIVN